MSDVFITGVLETQTQPNISSVGILDSIQISGVSTLSDIISSRISIGTSLSSFPLDVSGDTNVSGNLTINSDTLFVDAIKKQIGIGTTTPTSQLTIPTPDPATDFPILDFRNPTYGIYSTSTSVPSRGNSLRFKSTDYNSTNITEREILIMQPQGRVGIGRTPTSTNFEVQGGSSTEGIWVVNNTASSIHLGNGISDNSSQRLTLKQTGSSSFISWTGNGNLDFVVGTTPAIRYVMNGNNGRFGIFDTTANAITPERALHVRGDSIRLDRSGVSTGFQIHQYAGGGYTTIQKGFQIIVNATGVNNGDFQIQDYGTSVSGGGTRRLTIGNTGNIGIGSNITTPSYSLEVEGAIATRSGYQTRTGSSGVFGSNIYNFNWANPNMDLYVDTTRIGSMAFTDRWNAGDTIQTRSFNQENATPSQYVFNSGIFATWVSISFTPKSNASRIIVQADGHYSISGTGTDNLRVRVVDAGVEKFLKKQIFSDTTGGAGRSGVLLPLICSYNNTTTTTRNIQVQFARNGSDDDITLTDGLNEDWSIIISEVKV